MPLAGVPVPLPRGMPENRPAMKTIGGSYCRSFVVFRAENRGARFVTVAAIAFPAGQTFSTKGVLEGVIAEEAVGSRGFGYDPVFFLPEYRQTLAQLSPDVKNRISHRARAFTQARTLLEQMMAEQNSVGA
jgi:XTP/dITP diphosphohydrolase